MLEAKLHPGRSVAWQLQLQLNFEERFLPEPLIFHNKALCAGLDCHNASLKIASAFISPPSLIHCAFLRI
jgi:hypothetical protein